MQTREEKIKIERAGRRKTRARKKLLAAKAWPRLSVFRSNTKMYAQVIDDTKGVTLVSVHEKELKDAAGTPVVKAENLGVLLAEKAIDKKIKQVVFDKGGYRYHGRVKAFADGARKGGLQF